MFVHVLGNMVLLISMAAAIRSGRQEGKTHFIASALSAVYISDTLPRKTSKLRKSFTESIELYVMETAMYTTSLPRKTEQTMVDLYCLLFIVR